MNENLIQKTNEWKQLERNTQELRKKADTFYEEQLMDLIREDYIARNKDQVFEPVDCMVVSVGTSYEPIVLNLSLFEPKKILFLYTEKTKAILDKVVDYCGLKVSSFEKKCVNETDPVDIYKEIKAIYLEWNKPSQMYIDLTGGTKAMSVACAMAGSVIGVQLIYVGSNDYLADFRKPNPGSETLFFIDNPMVVFGDLEIEKALALFAEHNYAGAKEKLAVLKESIPDPEIRQQLNFIYMLSLAYESWDALDFIPAYEMLSQLNAQLKRDRIHKKYLLMDCTGQLNRQQQLLGYVKDIPQMIKEKRNMDILKDKNIISSLMFTMFQNAMTRDEQDKLDMATLLFYRLLEMIEQRRLSHYNLYVSAMDYSKMKCNVKRQPRFADRTSAECMAILKDEVNRIKVAVFGKNTSSYLPDQVSLLEGYIILYAMHDPIVYQGDEDKMVLLKRIRSMVYLRNNSIFAHGLGPVRREDYEKFRNFVTDLFGRFCKIEKIDFEDMKSVIAWINPIESGNYISMED